MIRPAVKPRLVALVVALACVFASGSAMAQEKTAAPAKAEAQGEARAERPKGDPIMGHVLNSREIAVPSTGHGWEREIELPRWAPIHIGPLTIDLSPTKHVVMLWFAGALCLIVMTLAGRGATAARAEG